MSGAKINTLLHHDNQGEKGTEILFHSFHLLLAMKKTARSTFILTTRILVVKISVVQFF